MRWHKNGHPIRKLILLWAKWHGGINRSAVEKFISINSIWFSFRLSTWNDTWHILCVVPHAMWWSFVGNALPLPSTFYYYFFYLNLLHVFLLAKISKGIESSQFSFRPFAYYKRSRTYCTQMCSINRFIIESQTDFIFLDNEKKSWWKMLETRYNSKVSIAERNTPLRIWR